MSTLLQQQTEAAMVSFAHKAETLNARLVECRDASDDHTYAIENEEASIVSQVSLDGVLNQFDWSERIAPDNSFGLNRQVYMVDGVKTRPTANDFRKLLAVVLYNMAMISRERVNGYSAAGNNPDLTLESARSLYEVVLVLDIRSSNSNTKATTQTVPPLLHSEPFDLTYLRMALYNNLGYICVFFYRSFKALYFRKTLDRMLSGVTLGHGQRGRGLVDVGDGDMYHAFRQGRLHFARNHLSKAPAA